MCARLEDETFFDDPEGYRLAKENNAEALATPAPVTTPGRDFIESVEDVMRRLGPGHWATMRLGEALAAAKEPRG